MNGCSTTAFSAATGGYTQPVSVVDPRLNLRIDPDTRAPRTDELSVGVDREVGRGLALAVAYVRKDGANFIGWTDVAGQYRLETRVLPDGRTYRLDSFMGLNEIGDAGLRDQVDQHYRSTFGASAAVEKVF